MKCSYFINFHNRLWLVWHFSNANKSKDRADVGICKKKKYSHHIHQSQSTQTSPVIRSHTYTQTPSPMHNLNLFFLPMGICKWLMAHEHWLKDQASTIYTVTCIRLFAYAHTKIGMQMTRFFFVDNISQIVHNITLLQFGHMDSWPSCCNVTSARSLI